MASPIHSLPEISGPSMAGKEETHNEANRRLEQGANWFVFKSRATTAQPGTPADGDCYLLPTSPTGANWSGQGGKIAQRISSAWVFLTPAEGMAGYVADENTAIVYNGSAWGAVGGGSNPTESIIIACSDETTALTAGTAKVTFRMPYAFTLTAVRASVTTAPTGSVLTVDINENGTSILSTKLTIDATEKTSTTAATPPVISDSALADDAEITIDIDAVGGTIAGAGLKVVLIGSRT